MLGTMPNVRSIISPGVRLLAIVIVCLATIAPALGQSGGGYTLDEAVAAARQRTSGKVLRATTTSSNGRSVHEIRVLTKDGHVRTLRFKNKRGKNKER